MSDAKLPARLEFHRDTRELRVHEIGGCATVGSLVAYTAASFGPEVERRWNGYEALRVALARLAEATCVCARHLPPYNCDASCEHRAALRAAEDLLAAEPGR